MNFNRKHKTKGDWRRIDETIKYIPYLFQIHRDILNSSGFLSLLISIIRKKKKLEERKSNLILSFSFILEER